MSKHGDILVSWSYHGKGGAVFTYGVTHANPDFLDDVKERANPGRKNGRVKAVLMSVEMWVETVPGKPAGKWVYLYSYDWRRPVGGLETDRLRWRRGKVPS